MHIRQHAMSFCTFFRFEMFAKCTFRGPLLLQKMHATGIMNGNRETKMNNPKMHVGYVQATLFQTFLSFSPEVCVNFRRFLGFSFCRLLGYPNHNPCPSPEDVPMDCLKKWELRSPFVKSFSGDGTSAGSIHHVMRSFPAKIWQKNATSHDVVEPLKAIIFRIT